MGQESERFYLSGTGYSDIVDWEFYCTEGRRSGKWTTIGVPSQWELQGFGEYNYGHDEDQSREVGRYRHRFRPPPAWRGRTVELVFDGVMTDAEVRLNGRSAGPLHQGAFYRFRYDVTPLLDWDGENVLEVDVAKHSSNRSVNAAERDADYWVFGGIFRPVYLEGSPRESIAHVAVDAHDDGTLRVRARLRGLEGPARLVGRVRTLDGAELQTFPAVAADSEEVELRGSFAEPRPWSAEDPYLYRLELVLERGSFVLHRRSVRFGFRTVEVVAGQGLFVNGHRVVLKGVNRHAFWPDSGRTLSGALDRADVELMKAMNMNAVRTAHYPPDESFLDAADELGLYVLDELAGWHDPYDTEVGRRLVREMVERDASHPSILFWTNGNEDGWNDQLDAVFGEHDLQGRPVLRPRSVASGVDTLHYPTWDELQEGLDPSQRPFWRRRRSDDGTLFMPTEALHGLYDGGSGASLEDYWRALRASPRGAGIFLWAFTDEAVKRTDQDGVLDTDGNHAPDGVLGPYRELSANFYAVREVFSPVAIEETLLDDGFDGWLAVHNRYDMTSLSEVRFRWTWLVLPRPFGDGEERVLASGERAGPAVEPGGRGTLRIPLAAWSEAEALRLTAFDGLGRDVGTWVLPRFDRRRMAWRLVEQGEGFVSGGVDGNRFRLRAGTTTEVAFDLDTGEAQEIVRDERRLHLGGPRSADGTVPRVLATRHGTDGVGYFFEARYATGLKTARWTLYPSGWLRLSYRYDVRGGEDFFGVLFPYPEEGVIGLEWLGLGPGRIWRNRRHGVLGKWRKLRKDVTPPEWAHEPKLAGYYGGVFWARIETSEGSLVLVPGSELDLGIARPAFPYDAEDARAELPPAGISLLGNLPAIGTKFHPASELGPQGQPPETEGLQFGTVWLFLGKR